MRLSLSSSPSPYPLRSKSRVKRKLAILKRAMTETNSGRSSRGGQTRSGWHQSPVSDGGQMQRSFHRCRGSGIAAQEQMKHLAKKKKLQRKLEERTRNTPFAWRIGKPMEVLMKTPEPESIEGPTVSGRLEKKREFWENYCLRFWSGGSSKKKNCGTNSKNTLPRRTQRRDERVPWERKSGRWHKARHRILRLTSLKLHQKTKELGWSERKKLVTVNREEILGRGSARGKRCVWRPRSPTEGWQFLVQKKSKCVLCCFPLDPERGSLVSSVPARKWWRQGCVWRPRSAEV